MVAKINENAELFMVKPKLARRLDEMEAAIRKPSFRGSKGRANEVKSYKLPWRCAAGSRNS